MSLASGFRNVTDRCFTFVIGSMPIFPMCKPHQMRTRIHMLPIKISISTINFKYKRVLAHLQFFETENCKQTDTFFFNQQQHGSKNPGLNKPVFFYFCTRDYLPDNIRPGYGPLKEVYICWGLLLISNILIHLKNC